MDRQGSQEAQVLRGLLLARLALLIPFFAVVVVATRCKGHLTTTLIFLLLAMASLPTLAYFLNRDWLVRPSVAKAIVPFDFVLASLLSYLARQEQVMPIFFPLYFSIVAVQAACWWGWPGALISGAAGGAFLSMLYLNSLILQPNQGQGMLALAMAWPVVLGFFTQWFMRQWRDRRRMAEWVAQQENLMRQVKERLESWNETCEALRAAASPQELLRTALREATTKTGSRLGLVVMQDRYTGAFRAECWEGFAPPGPGKMMLRPAQVLPAADGNGEIEVQHVLEAPLRTSSSTFSEGRPSGLGRIAVARENDVPYEEEDGLWLHILANYTAALLENRFLRGQLGRIREEADSIAFAGTTLAALPDPAVAMEMACRNILNAMDLDQVVILLYGEETASGCQVIAYPAQQPAQRTAFSLQGRGLRLLRHFLDGGTSLVVNRRSECPELFSLMAWSEDIQAAACFPLCVREHRWGALCLLARVPDAFPAETEKNLAIFSGKIAMALENSYLRYSAAGAKL